MTDIATVSRVNMIKNIYIPRYPIYERESHELDVFNVSLDKTEYKLAQNKIIANVYAVIQSVKNNNIVNFKLRDVGDVRDDQMSTISKKMTYGDYMHVFYTNEYNTISQNEASKKEIDEVIQIYIDRYGQIGQIPTLDELSMINAKYRSIIPLNKEGLSPLSGDENRDYFVTEGKINWKALYRAFLYRTEGWDECLKSEKYNIDEIAFLIVQRNMEIGYVIVKMIEDNSISELNDELNVALSKSKDVDIVLNEFGYAREIIDKVREFAQNSEIKGKLMWLDITAILKVLKEYTKWNDEKYEIFVRLSAKIIKWSFKELTIRENCTLSKNLHMETMTKADNSMEKQYVFGNINVLQNNGYVDSDHNQTCPKYFRSMEMIVNREGFIHNHFIEWNKWINDMYTVYASLTDIPYPIRFVLDDDTVTPYKYRYQTQSQISSQSIDDFFSSEIVAIVYIQYKSDDLATKKHKHDIYLLIMYDSRPMNERSDWYDMIYGVISRTFIYNPSGFYVYRGEIFRFKNTTYTEFNMLVDHMKLNVYESVDKDNLLFFSRKKFTNPEKKDKVRNIEFVYTKGKTSYRHILRKIDLPRPHKTIYNMQLIDFMHRHSYSVYWSYPSHDPKYVKYDGYYICDYKISQSEMEDLKVCQMVLLPGDIISLVFTSKQTIDIKFVANKSYQCYRSNVYGEYGYIYAIHVRDNPKIMNNKKKYKKIYISRCSVMNQPKSKLKGGSHAKDLLKNIDLQLSNELIYRDDNISPLCNKYMDTEIYTWNQFKKTHNIDDYKNYNDFVKEFIIQKYAMYEYSFIVCVSSVALEKKKIIKKIHRMYSVSDLINYKDCPRPIIKYKPHNIIFWYFYEDLYNYKLVPFNKKIDILELSNNPVFFEAIYYYENKYTNKISNYNLIYFSKYTYLQTDSIENMLKHYSQDYDINIVVHDAYMNVDFIINDANKKYDLILSNLSSIVFGLVLYEQSNIVIIYYILMYAMHHLNIGGTIYININYTCTKAMADIFLIGSMYFKDINLSYPEIHNNAKFSGTSVIFQNFKGIKQDELDAYMRVAQQLYDEKLTTYLKINVTDEKIRRKYDIVSPPDPNLDYKYIKQFLNIPSDDLVYDFIRDFNKQLFHKKINYLEKLIRYHGSKKEVQDKMKQVIREEQLINSVLWAKKYDFDTIMAEDEVFSSYYSKLILKDVFAYQKDIEYTLNKCISESDANMINLDSFDDFHMMRRKIYMSEYLINTRDIEKWNDMKAKISFYKNKDETYRLTTYVSGTYNTDKITNDWLTAYEILHKFELILGISSLKSFHLCESGQFVLATNHYIKTKIKHDVDWIWNAQNLNNKEKQSKKWDFGSDNSGDITKIQNMNHYKKYFADIDFVTSGCSLKRRGEKYDRIMEIHNAGLTMILLNLPTHKHFVAKFSMPIAHSSEIGMIYIMCKYFEKVHIFRSRINRYSKEFYIVCLKYEGIPKSLKDKLMENYKNYDKDYAYFESYPVNFIYDLSKILTKLSDNYIFNIDRQLYYVDNQDIIEDTHYKELAKQFHIKNMNWCEDYELERIETEDRMKL